MIIYKIYTVINYFENLKAQWSIFFPRSVFTGATFQLIRLFEIISKTTSNIYSNADYFQSQSKLEISTLVDSIYNKKTIYFNTSLTSFLIIAWSKPSLILYTNCQIIAKIDFIQSTDLTVLSLPYYQPDVIKSVGSELQPLANSLLQGGCQTTGSSTTLPTTITTSVSSSQTPNAINISGTFLENFVFLENINYSGGHGH